MSIFETFYLLFKADSSQLKKEVDDVKKKTGELTDVSKASEDQAKKTDNEFSKLAGTLGKVAAGYFSVGAVVNGFKNAFANTTDIGNLSRDYGVNAEALDAWSKAAKNAGYSAEAFRSQFFEFAKAFNSEPNVALSYLPALSDALKNAGTIFQAQTFGQQRGIGPELVSFLYNTEREDLIALVEEQRRIGVVSPEDIDNLRKFKAELSKLGNAFDELYRSVGIKLLPALTELVTVFTKVASIFTTGKNPFNTETEAQKADRLYAEKLQSDIWEKIFGKSAPSSSSPTRSIGDIWDSLFNKAGTGFNGWEDYGGEYTKTFESPQSFYVPPTIPSVTNSQASSIAFNGDINVNTTAQDAKGIASGIVGEINAQSKTLLAQLQQSNANFDNTVVI